MINIKTKLILPIAGLVMIGVITFGTTRAYAQTPTEKLQTIVSQLAQKFGLKESDVQAVFDQNRTQRQTQMQQKFEDRLTQLVKDGKLTEAQKQLILAKHSQLQGSMVKKPDNWQSMTADQKREFMETQKESITKWAKDNNIDVEYVLGGFGMRAKNWKGK